MQQSRNNSLINKKAYSKAEKYAIKWFAKDKLKGMKIGLSASKICKVINNECNTNLHSWTVQQQVKEGMICESLIKNGAPVKIPHTLFTPLCQAFETYVKVNQFNGKGGNNVQKKFAMLLNQVIGKESDKTFSYTL